MRINKMAASLLILPAFLILISCGGKTTVGTLPPGGLNGGEGSPPPTSPTTKSHTVALNWQAPSTGANGYNVYRGISSGGPYSAIGSSPTITFTDANVQSGTTYYYVTTAYNSAGESPFSNEATVVVPNP